MSTPTIIGRQTFDGLGRQLSVEVGGNTTRFDYIDGQLPPAANTLADGKKITFTYEKALNNQLLSIAAEGETTTLISRHPMLGQPSFIEAELGTQAFEFTAAGQPDNDNWTVDGKTHTTRWRHSLSGLLQGFNDAQGVVHERHLDAVGRVEKTRVADVETTYTYDALSRPLTVSVIDPQSQQALTTSLTYDALGREHTRTFTVVQTTDAEAGEAPEATTRTLTQTLSYSGLDQITSRTWTDGEAQGEETFEYDVRNRLVRCTANAWAAAEDPYGNRIVEQVFTFNAFNGYKKVVSTFIDGTHDEAVFSYAKNDPTRVVEITHTHPSWPSQVTLTYDACGRVVSDSLGRNLSWNTQGRLTEVQTPTGTCTYRYDPSGQLTDREVNGILTRDFFSADQLTHKQTDEDSIQLIGDMDALFAVNKVTDGVRQTILLGTDAQGSVRMEAGNTVRARRYSAHGADVATADNEPFGYTGEQCEPVSGWYIPGGYRPYDPVLMCFLAPDTDSPFGQGGINPYAWCDGDPVNRVDPDGHSWVSYALAVTGIVLGFIGLIPGLQALPAFGVLFSTGTSLLTTSNITALVATTLDIVALATGAASTLLEASGNDGKASSILGAISLVTGLAGAGLGLKLGFRRAGTHGFKSTPRKQADYEVIYEAASNSVDVGFIPNYHRTKRAAFVTHGDPLRPILMGPDGKPMSAAEFARTVISPRLANLPDADATIVLVSCWGAKNGAALEIARELNRPVQAFTHKAYIKFVNLAQPANKNTIAKEANPYFERLLATRNPVKAWKTTYREAASKIFYPPAAASAA
ncbi:MULTISPECIES: RHS repeat-associated core domain-containing protein [unclassified Pseudomonas]|uniref:RHS repeat-associated core domain-containing protein n=1 Tax=unclassified Pseudomonas TaxID=196821 RepID=UPI00385105F8